MEGRSGLGGLNSVDTVAASGRTLAERNKRAPGGKPREWGMFFTVTSDPNPANNTQWILRYGLVDQDKFNNANWQTFSDYLKSLGFGWAIENVDASGPEVVLNFGGLQQKLFQLTEITGPKTFEVTAQENAVQLIFRFTISGGFHELTMPADFKMADPLWNPFTKIWTAPDEGDYEAIATYDGIYWYLKIVGTYL